jgi:phage gp29-like protein
LDRPTFDEIASIADGRDITRPWIAPLLASQDEILESKGGGDLLVYEQLLTDTQIESGYQQRFSALIGCENEVVAGGTKRLDIKAADFIREQLAGINWDDITEKQLYATHYGYGVAECLWMRDGANVMLDDTRDGIRVRNRRRFKFAPDRSLRLIVWGDMFQGETMPDRKFWTLRSGGDNHDEPYGRGLGHNLYWPVFFKRNDMRFWLRFLEKFSQPTVKVEYPSGMPKDQQDELLQSAYRMASASALKVPQGTVIDFLEAGRSGTADYVKLWELMDAAISKTILSQTMTTDSGSSLSQAQVHEGVASRLLKRDADLICASFNRSVIRWLVDWNYPGAAYPKVWRKIDPAADLKGMADRDKVLFDMGYAPNVDYVVDTYGEGFRPAEKGEASPIALNGAQVTALTDVISQAINDGWIPELAVATIQASFPTIGVELIQAIAEQLQAQADKTTIQPESSDPPIVLADQPAPVSAEFAEEEPDTVDIYTDRLRTTAGKEVDGWLDQISGLLDTAGDLASFSETLLTLYPDLKGDRLRDIMGDAVLAASIAGSLEGDA